MPARTRASAIQRSTVARWPPTSTSRISSSTGSTLAGTLSSRLRRRWRPARASATAASMTATAIPSTAGHFDYRRRVEHVFAGGDAVGERLHALQIGVDAAFAAQCRVQLRQGVESLVDHRHDRGRGGARAVEHAVEHVLDLPAELAQCLGTDQAATALQGVEDAPDRTQLLQIVRRSAPGRQHLVEVVDFLLELFEEDFADFVVDFVASDFETAGLAGADRSRGRCGCDRFDRLRRGDFGSCRRMKLGRVDSAGRELALRAALRPALQRRPGRASAPASAPPLATASSPAIRGCCGRCRECHRDWRAARAAPPGSTRCSPARRPGCRAGDHWARGGGR